MKDKLRFEITAPNVEQLEELTGLLRDVLADLRACGADENKINEYAERFIEIMGFK